MATTAVSSSQATTYQPTIDGESDIHRVQGSPDDFGLSHIATALAELEESTPSITSRERPVLQCIATLLSAVSRLITTFKESMSTMGRSDVDADTSPIEESSEAARETATDSPTTVAPDSGVSPETQDSFPDPIGDKTEPAEKWGSEVTTPENKMLETGTLLGKTGGFLWKPLSDKNKKLAVLLPKNLTGKVKSVSILSPDKKKILQSGTYSGVGNGGREHFRFTKAGSSFPDGAIVLIKLQDGTSRHVTIKETSARTTR